MELAQKGLSPEIEGRFLQEHASLVKLSERISAFNLEIEDESGFCMDL